VNIGGTTATVPIPNADRVIAGLRPRFKNCYQAGLNSDPTMSGKVVVMVRVGPNGEVSSASMVSSSGMSQAAVECVVRQLKAPQFEAIGGGGSTLNVPLTFVQAK
jgi:TonB family protein